MITLSSPAPPSAAERIDQMVTRRLAGEPLQYVLGRWGFRQLDLLVDRRVLIPRPETEQLVEAAVSMLDTLERPLVADLGTGSGAIALSLALELASAEVYATDASVDALEVARRNLESLPVEARARVHLLEGSWFEALPQQVRGQLDMIVSNPPYIGIREWDDIDAQVKQWEPQSALFSGDDGLTAIRTIFEGAGEWLNERGTLLIEVGSSQAGEAQRLAWDGGYFSVQVGRDLAGRQRWIMAKKAG